jgi:PAS domain S-box-containing protein
MSRLPRTLWIGLALIVAPLIAFIWLETYQLAHGVPELRRSRALVNHSFEVITTTQELDRTLDDAERAQRNFLLSGDEESRDAYRAAAARLPVLLAQLQRQTAGYPEHQSSWPALKQQIDAKLAELQRVIDVRDGGSYEAARLVARANNRLNTMRGVDTLIDAALATENVVLVRRLARTAQDEQRTEALAWSSGMLALVVLLAGALLLASSLRRALASEAARRGSEAQLRILVDGLTDHAIYRLDRDGTIKDWNTGAERLKGYTAAEMIGQHFSRLFTAEDHAAGVPGQVLAIAASTGKYEAECWRIRKDGSRFWASVVIEPLRDAAGELTGFAKITRDMTESLQQQQALEQARSALAQAQKMEALGQLSGGIAHDYNNLLHVIRNAVELLQRRLGAVDADALRLIEMVKRNADRAAALTQRLLAFSRLQPLEARAVDPNKLVAGMAELVRHALGETISLETVLAGGAWPVLADANQLESAILNLAVNARDAMPEGGRLTLETGNTYLEESGAAAPEVKPGPYVQIAVRDTGIGMAPEVAARAFDPFFTTKGIGKGTGLGLSQVYGFIKQSGGHVKLRSEPGKGTEVSLYLPRAMVSPSARAPEQPPPARISASQTILVVEDQPDVRAFTVQALHELGYRVIDAPNAQSALELLATEPEVALLFTDVGLPDGMNGRQLADEACRRQPRLKVLFTTGYTRDIVHHGRLDPGVELLVKPFTTLSLAARINKLISATAVAS